VPISHDSYQLARSDSLGSTPFFQVLAGLLGKTAKSEARRPLASGDNYLNSASPVSSSSGNLDIYIISKGDKVSNKAINRITRYATSNKRAYFGFINTNYFGRLNLSKVPSL